MNVMDRIKKEQCKSEVPEFRVGDGVKVFVKIVEGTTERLQAFSGIVIARKGGGINETFTVRRISYGHGVERTFPLHSPLVSRIELERYGKVRRGKLYYLRDKVGKKAKVKERKHKTSA
jgi:large subunit ribosomal protein L19